MELRVPADQQTVHPPRGALRVEREVAGLLEDCVEHRAGFDARKDGPDAEVDAVLESEMALGNPRVGSRSVA